MLDENELRSANHTNKDPNYIGIGDSTLIKRRGTKNISLQPGGSFKDYVAFYFGARSPMLYEIKNGFNDVTKRDQENIIYLITSVDLIIKHNCDFVFFDGHGYHNFSACYNDLADLANVDWNVVKAKYWNNREDDMDRKRRKQAEFLVHNAVPWATIQTLCVYNISAKQKVKQLLNSRNISCSVTIKPNYYY